MHLLPGQDVISKAIESLGTTGLQRKYPYWWTAPGLEIVANEGLLEQALVNLLDNAVKYGPEGGTVRVKATLDTSDGLDS
jgi:signal transduction histidine kinase